MRPTCPLITDSNSASIFNNYSLCCYVNLVLITGTVPHSPFHVGMDSSSSGADSTSSVVPQTLLASGWCHFSAYLHERSIFLFSYPSSCQFHSLPFLSCVTHHMGLATGPIIYYYLWVITLKLHHLVLILYLWYSGHTMYSVDYELFFSYLVLLLSSPPFSLRLLGYVTKHSDHFSYRLPIFL